LHLTGRATASFAIERRAPGLVAVSANWVWAAAGLSLAFAPSRVWSDRRVKGSALATAQPATIAASIW
jgi:hypothetical protein